MNNNVVWKDLTPCFANKKLLRIELETALRETYQEMFKGEALKLALERLETALKQWEF